MRHAFAMTISGGYIACLYLSIHYPLFFHLHILLTGIIFGVALHDLLQSFERDADPTPGLTRTFQEHALQPNPQKMQAIHKLKMMLDKKLIGVRPAIWLMGPEAKAYVESLKPDVLNLYDDVLWCVINEGEHYAFRNPKDPDHTIVMRKEFAEKALVLGYLP